MTLSAHSHTLVETPELQRVSEPEVESSQLLSPPSATNSPSLPVLPALTQPKLEPHVQPLSFASGWAWSLFMTSVVLFVGTVFFTSVTSTGPALLIQSEPSQR